MYDIISLLETCIDDCVVDMKEIKRLIPNILTVLRLAMVPLFIWAFLNPGMVFKGRLLAFIICMSASATDFLDGQLARRWNVCLLYTSRCV